MELAVDLDREIVRYEAKIDAADGWHWRSSLTREDDGNGACELVYTCAITPR